MSTFGEVLPSLSTSYTIVIDCTALFTLVITFGKFFKISTTSLVKDLCIMVLKFTL